MNLMEFQIYTTGLNLKWFYVELFGGRVITCIENIVQLGQVVSEIPSGQMERQTRRHDAHRSASHLSTAEKYCSVLFCSVLFFSRPRSDGWLPHGRTFSIYLCPLSF